MMKNIVDSRWFALLDFACVVAGAVLLEFFPKLGWRVFLLALLPWLLRLLIGKFPFHRTPFDIPLIIFISTAGIGVWAAYKQKLAWTKFWLLVIAVLLFYSIAGQPKSNLWLVAGLLGSAGVLMSGYYLMTHDWQSEPAKFGVINQIGIGWQVVRPRLVAQPVHANTVAGIVGILTPFLVAVVIYTWRERYFATAAVAALSVGISLVCLILTTSRGAWLASLTTTTAIFLWGLSKKIADKVSLQSGLLFGSAIILAGSLTSGLLFRNSAIQPALIVDLSQLPFDITRMKLNESALALVGDFPLTGGGLASFSGLFSGYILMYPSPFLFHSHNTFLDITVEQGILGFLSIVWILIGSISFLVLLKEKGSLTILRWGVLASLSILVIHGLFDDVVYYVVQAKNAPLLLVPAGMAVALVQPDFRKPVRITQPVPRKIVIPGLALVAVLLLAGLFYRPLQSTWNANLGAVEMARAELPNWGTGVWTDGSGSIALTLASPLFHRALEFDPDNRTANHRLGLIALQSRDFSSAILHLEQAHQTDPNHRGIRKALGYSYLWNGQPELAYNLLSGFPEVGNELYNYPLWWRNQGQAEQAIYAEILYARILTSTKP